MAWRRVWVILIPAAVFAAAVAGYSLTLPDQYRSDTLILVVPQRVPESYVRSTVTTKIEDRLQSIAQQIMSRTRLERIIVDFNLYERARREGIMEDVVQKMRKDIGVEVVKGDAFRINYTGEDPRMVMRVTDRLASLFIEENLRDREMLAEGTNQFLEAQLEDARRRLVEHEKKLEQFRQRHAGSLPTQLESNLQAIANTQMQVQALIDSSNRDRDRKLNVERMLADLNLPENEQVLPAPTVNAPDGTAMAGYTAAQRLDAARTLMRQMEARYKPEHPDMIRMRKTVEDLEKKAEAEALEQPLSPAAAPVRPTMLQLAKRNRVRELQQELESLDRQIAAKGAEERRLRAVAGSYQSRIDVVPSLETDMTELTRDYTTLQSVYTSLLQRKEDSKVAANLERRQIGEQFKLLDPARIPEKPVNPNRTRINLIGIVAGLALGLALVALLEYRDTTVNTDEEVRLALQLPVLATIPVMLSMQEKKRSRRRRFALGAAAATLVLSCGAVVVWTLLKASRVI
jgi:polysaccharide chain length determinant protein (PEP-CTERM system associated)